MEFFADTAEIHEIRELKAMGLIDGVTTNPTLIAKSGRRLETVISEICETVSGPVSAEVVSGRYEEMVAEGAALSKIAANVVIKLPLTIDGLRACQYFASQDKSTNITLCFSATQALLAAKAGATYVSPFIGRLDDTQVDGMALIQEIGTIYRNFEFKTKILAASIRSVNHVKSAAMAGAQAATMSPTILRKIVEHPLTEKGVAEFTKDWALTGQSIV